GHVVLTYGQAAPAAPALPTRVANGSLTTVDARGGSGPRYRVTSFSDPDGSGQTVVAVPLREVDQTLNRLLLVESLVIGGVLLALGALAFFVVRLGLRPLDRMARTAGAIAAGDLSRRVSPATPKTEVGRLGIALNGTLARLDEVHDSVRHEVDVTALARDAIDDARVTAPERPFELHADGDAVVVGDPHQLRQVLGNLVRNALVHTPAGTPIEIAVARD